MGVQKQNGLMYDGRSNLPAPYKFGDNQKISYEWRFGFQLPFECETWGQSKSYSNFT